MPIASASPATRITGSRIVRNLDEIEFVSIPEQSTMASALRAGEVDLIMRVSAQLTQTLRDAPGIELAFTPP